MKKRLICAAMLASVMAVGFGNSAECQDTSTSQLPAEFMPLVEMLRADLRAEKLTIVTENMNLSSQEAKEFWPIYFDYDAQLREIWNRRITLIAEYASLYPNVSEEEASRLISESLDIDIRLSKLRKKAGRC